MIAERFAPSPTGLLHLGHAYSAYLAWQSAREAGGRFLLRLEDLDASRVRPEYVEAIEQDLAWLGLDWERPVLTQSTHADAYADALELLADMELTYRCICTRRDIAEAVSAPQEGSAIIGPDGPVYPGTCRTAGHDGSKIHAVRLNMSRALEVVGAADLAFEEIGSGADAGIGRHQLDRATLIDGTGDIVLARRDGAIAYHLAVVVDDAFQGITHVTRGADLFSATPIHRLLQALLELPTPIYRHHRLVRDDAGKRLAKRDDARSIAAYRQAGLGPDDVLALAAENLG